MYWLAKSTKKAEKNANNKRKAFLILNNCNWDPKIDKTWIEIDKKLYKNGPLKIISQTGRSLILLYILCPCFRLIGVRFPVSNLVRNLMIELIPLGEFLAKKLLWIRLKDKRASLLEFDILFIWSLTQNKWRQTRFKSHNLIRPLGLGLMDNKVENYSMTS